MVISNQLSQEQLAAGLLPDWQRRLEKRGIFNAAKLLNWQPGEWFGEKGWMYELYQANGDRWILPESAGVAKGRPVRRWKAFSSEAAYKYTWGYPDQQKGDIRRPEGCSFYWLPGGTVKADIEANDKSLYIACGEPDFMTLVELGKRNVTTFFGEGTIPDNLTDILQKLGVETVFYYPDNDNTGWDTAEKLYTMLAGSGIQFAARSLPQEINNTPIKDLNDIWRAVNFDRMAFWNATVEGNFIQFLKQRETMPGVGVDNGAEWDKYHAAIERALGAQWKNNRGWSKPMACIFGNHEHDDRHPSAGYHKEKHIYRCFKCGESWEGDVVADHFNIPRPRPPQKESVNGVVHHDEPENTIAIYSSDDSLLRYKERMRGVNVMEHIPFPFRSLHHLGGFCKVVPLCKIIGILGLSGGGKTSFIETLTDTWRQMGFHILWWGPEWTWEEMADRAVQRWGGLSMIDMMEYEMWLTEEAHNVPLDHRLGRNQPAEIVDRTEKIVDRILAWPGKAYYLDKMDVTLRQLLDAAQTRIDELALLGNKPRMAVFDYIQLAEVSGARGDSERIPRAVSQIKAFCTDNRMVGIIGTQARKDDSEKAREDHELLTAEAAQYFRDDKTNLFITLNPLFDEDGNMTGQGTINVVKNSGGRRGKVEAMPDPARLRWKDTRGV